MPPMRATYFFESGKYGWSETFALLSGTHSDVLAKAVALLPLRMRLCGPGVTCSYVRASDDALQRDVLPWRVGLTTVESSTEAETIQAGGGTTITPVITVSRADRPYSAILCRFAGPQFQTRNHYLRGMPDHIIRHPLGPLANAGWYTAFDLWVGNLIAGGWGFVGTKRALPGQPDVRVISFSSVSRLFTTQEHAWPFSFRARFSGFKGPLVPQGLYTMKSLALDQVYIQGDDKPWTITTFGTLKMLETEFIPFVTGSVTGQTHRDTGAPFDRPRGRRRVRR